MLLYILLAVAAIIVVVLLVAMTKPDTFTVERSISSSASPEQLFPKLNDFHAWAAWSPWEKIDPDMRRTFSGAPNGTGAIYAWEGNKKVGAGRMEITAQTPESSLTIKLDFLRPFEAHNITTFTLTATGTGTSVRWQMAGPNTFMGKVMSVFMNMDTMIGGDFERGLEKLTRTAEG